MAEIEIERRPRRSGWTWVALVLVLAGVAIGAWLIFGDGIDTRSDASPAAETTVEEPLTEPVSPLDAPAIPPGEAPPEGDGGEGDAQPQVRPEQPPQPQAR